MTTDDASAVWAREMAATELKGDREMADDVVRTANCCHDPDDCLRCGEQRETIVAMLQAVRVATLTAHGEAIRAEMQASSVTALHRVQVELEAFDALAEEWHADTDHLSVTWQKALHESYQQIIGMGPAAVPHILRHLRTRGGKWLWALRAIARADVSEGASDKEAVVRAWEAWARRRGLV